MSPCFKAKLPEATVSSQMSPAVSKPDSSTSSLHALTSSHPDRSELPVRTPEPAAFSPTVSPLVDITVPYIRDLTPTPITFDEYDVQDFKPFNQVESVPVRGDVLPLPPLPTPHIQLETPQPHEQGISDSGETVGVPLSSNIGVRGEVTPQSILTPRLSEEFTIFMGTSSLKATLSPSPIPEMIPSKPDPLPIKTEVAQKTAVVFKDEVSPELKPKADSSSGDSSVNSPLRILIVSEPWANESGKSKH